MNACNLFCELFSQINWIWFVVAVAITFGIGAIWYSFLFAKTWIRVFKVEMPGKIKSSSMIGTMLMQLAVNILFGLTFFILVKVSFGLALLVLISFCGWQKGSLNFQFAKWKDFVQAAIIQAGYTFMVGITFILFALI